MCLIFIVTLRNISGVTHDKTRIYDGAEEAEDGVEYVGKRTATNDKRPTIQFRINEGVVVNSATYRVLKIWNMISWKETGSVAILEWKNWGPLRGQGKK